MGVCTEMMVREMLGEQVGDKRKLSGDTLAGEDEEHDKGGAIKSAKVAETSGARFDGIQTDQTDGSNGFEVEVVSEQAREMLARFAKGAVEAGEVTKEPSNGKNKISETSPQGNLTAEKEKSVKDRLAGQESTGEGAAILHSEVSTSKSPAEELISKLMQTTNVMKGQQGVDHEVNRNGRLV